MTRVTESSSFMDIKACEGAIISRMPGPPAGPSPRMNTNIPGRTVPDMMPWAASSSLS